MSQLFSATNQPATKGGRPARRVLYAGQIARAEDLLAANLDVAVVAAIAIAKGEALDHLINHKTGQVHEVPCDAATRLKAAQFIVERIAGKPEQQKTHELGEGAAGLFRVLLGAPAEQHWQETSIDAPFETPLLEEPLGEPE